jgi:hypothetical protein
MHSPRAANTTDKSKMEEAKQPMARRDCLAQPMKKQDLSRPVTYSQAIIPYTVEEDIDNVTQKF